jgi:hypothetical protein
MPNPHVADAPELPPFLRPSMVMLTSEAVPAKASRRPFRHVETLRQFHEHYGRWPVDYAG